MKAKTPYSVSILRRELFKLDADHDFLKRMVAPPYISDETAPIYRKRFKQSTKRIKDITAALKKLQS